MIKRIAICAVLVLMLVPAFAMAAGPQGQGSGADQEKGQMGQGSGSAQGTGQMAQQKFVYQNSGENQNVGAMQMVQNRICNQSCDMSGLMIRKQNQSGLMFSSGQSVLAARQQGQAGNVTRDAVMDRIRERIQLKDGSCVNCTRPTSS